RAPPRNCPALPGCPLHSSCQHPKEPGQQQTQGGHDKNLTFFDPENNVKNRRVIPRTLPTREY
ncbi:MAG: hypothetical protein QGG01_08360, partial [Roseibacillus sp.]|nr:hypothetical protein [Roseibacillus sp.]